MKGHHFYAFEKTITQYNDHPKIEKKKENYSMYKSKQSNEQITSRNYFYLVQLFIIV